MSTYTHETWRSHARQEHARDICGISPDDPEVKSAVTEMATQAIKSNFASAIEQIALEGVIAHASRLRQEVYWEIITLIEDSTAEPLRGCDSTCTCTRRLRYEERRAIIDLIKKKIIEEN